MDKNTLLHIEDLSVNFVVNKVKLEAVNHLNLRIEKGESLGLVGETGAGKTTTALSIMGLVPDPPGKIVSGEIYFEGKNLLASHRKKRLYEKEMRKIRGEKISMVFQDPMTSLNPLMKVGDQIAEVIKLHEKLTAAEAEQKAQQMLELVGIPAVRYNEYPHQFSGGMRQRVVIAIALACNPTLLIADEPTTALDVTIQAQVLDMIRSMKKKFDMAMLLITHDLGVVNEVCERVAIMYAGSIVEQGNVRTVFESPLHPYTEGLFGSIPSLDADADRLIPIPGMMPDPSNLPEGCPFFERCKYCTERCKSERPQMAPVGPEHEVACFRYSHAPQAGETV